MNNKTVTYDPSVDIDSEEFRRRIRMECHMAGYEVVDFGFNGHDSKPYVTFRKKKERKTMQAKERFFL